MTLLPEPKATIITKSVEVHDGSLTYSNYILLTKITATKITATKITAAQNEVAIIYHRDRLIRVRGLYFLLVIFAVEGYIFW